MPLGLLHFLEVTNFGYNSNMSFLVLQVDKLLEDLVSLPTVVHLAPCLGLRSQCFKYFIHRFVYYDVLRTASSFIPSVVSPSSNLDVVSLWIDCFLFEVVQSLAYATLRHPIQCSCDEAQNYEAPFSKGEPSVPTGSFMWSSVLS